jgi:hypothetical protein
MAERNEQNQLAGHYANQVQANKVFYDGNHSHNQNIYLGESAAPVLAPYRQKPCIANGMPYRLHVVGAVPFEMRRQELKGSGSRTRTTILFRTKDGTQFAEGLPPDHEPPWGMGLPVVVVEARDEYDRSLSWGTWAKGIPWRHYSDAWFTYYWRPKERLANYAMIVVWCLKLNFPIDYGISAYINTSGLVIITLITYWLLLRASRTRQRLIHLEMRGFAHEEYAE